MRTKLQKAGSMPTNDLVAFIETKPLEIVYKNMSSKTKPTFVVVTYWWGRGRANRNLQRPGPDEVGQKNDSLTAPIEYQEMINTWKRDCEAIGCPYIAQEYPEFARPGMYQTAINAKPMFIKKALETAVAAGYNGVVYIDGDMRFRTYPAIFDLSNVDYMARGWNIDPRASDSYRDSTCFDPFVFETSGGIMYFGNTRLSRSLLTEWIKANSRKANHGRADDRIISVIVNARNYLLKANIVQLPIEYLWLNDFYDPDLGGHIDAHDFKKSRLICEHPHCLTSEERAREQGAHSDRSHILYTYAVENLTVCQRMGGMFYDYIFFENEGAALDSYQTYLETMESIGLHGRITKRSSKSALPDPCLYHTSFKQRYGKYNKVVDTRLKNSGLTNESIFTNLSVKDSDPVELYGWAGHNPIDILEALMRGRPVLWLPTNYLNVKVLEAYRRTAKSSRFKAAPAASLTGGAPSTKKQLETLTELVKPLNSAIKRLKNTYRKEPDAEFIAFIKPQTNDQESLYQPVFDFNNPMYFAPTSRILRHLLLMTPDLEKEFNRIFNSSFIFLTGIRCHWL
jgi:hypothetical protein